MRSVHPLASGVIAAVVCVASAGQPDAFTDEAIARGVTYRVTHGLTQYGSGLALIDLDGDRDLDLVATGGAGGVIGLYENDGAGYFTDRSLAQGAPRFAPSLSVAGVSAADFDADGDLDLHICRFGEPDRLYRNDGGWNFTEVASAAGIANGGAAFGSVWGDFDGDGWLDVYVNNRTNTVIGFTLNTSENELYRNNGDGTFTPVGADLGVIALGEPTLVSAFFDFDLDGDADLYLGTDKGAFSPFHNHLFENVGGTFVDITASSGTEANVDCMGIAYGDMDGNGWPDIFVTNIPVGHKLLLNNGDRTFTHGEARAGVETFEIGWGTMCFDHDNDAIDDLYVCQMNATNCLYANSGSFPLVNVADSMAIDGDTTSFCVVSGDLDGDGDLDVVNAEIGRDLHIFINNEGSKRNWAQFDVVGRGANTFGVGAVVRVEAEGLLPQIREVRAGHHYKAVETPTLHFGLDEASAMSTISVAWPGGEVGRTLERYPINVRWTLYPPERMGDVNLDGEVDAEDVALLRDRLDLLGGSEPVKAGVNEQMDVVSDAVLNADDLVALTDVVGCGAADLAAPLGSLDIADVVEFLRAFGAAEPPADLAAPFGAFDIADVTSFLQAFGGGCP